MSYYRTNILANLLLCITKSSHGFWFWPSLSAVTYERGRRLTAEGEMGLAGLYWDSSGLIFSSPRPLFVYQSLDSFILES